MFVGELRSFGLEDPSQRHFGLRKIQDKLFSLSEGFKVSSLLDDIWQLALLKTNTNILTPHELPASTSETANSESFDESFASISALSCLRNVLKQCVKTQAENNTASEFLQKRQAILIRLIWEKVSAGNLAAHLLNLSQSLQQLIQNKPVKNESSKCNESHAVCSCIGKTELALSSTFRLIFSLLKHGYNHLENQQEGGEDEFVVSGLKSVCDSMTACCKVVWKSITIQEHKHCEGNQCLFGYLQQKFFGILLLMSNEPEEDFPQITSTVLQTIKDRQEYIFQPHHEQSADSLSCSPFFSAMVASSGHVQNVPSKRLQKKVFLFLLRQSCEIDWSQNELVIGARALLMLGLVSVFGSGHGSHGSQELSRSIVFFFSDEDTVMFEALTGFCDFFMAQRSQELCMEVKSHASTSMDDFCSFLDCLQPFSLFDAFLETIGYDSTTLIDFLISSEVGNSCLQYLLKVLKFRPETTKGASKSEMSKQSLLCLQALSKKLARLHSQSLFPYNPSPLIRRIEGILH